MNGVVHVLVGWLRGTIENPWRAEDAVFDLLRAALPAGGFMSLALGWAEESSTHPFAIGAIRGRCPSAEFDQIGRALLMHAATDEVGSELLGAADLHGVWTGPSSPKYRERAAFFEEWAKDANASVRRVGERGRDQFTKQALHAERRERMDENSYD
jgi:hypothetical protein